MGWKDKMESARRRHRPSLKNWECDGLQYTFPAFVQSILEEDSGYQTFEPFGRVACQKTHSIPAVLDAVNVSAREFMDHYEANAIPSVITNIPAGYDVPSPPPHPTPVSSDEDSDRHSSSSKSAHTNGSHRAEWPALSRWTLDALENDPDLRNRTLKCGEDDDGRSIRIKLKHFMSYLRKNKDDSPLYIFDSTFDDDRKAKRLLKDYRVPTYFNEDLFHLVGERRRPPYRWFLIGPERSGTTVHIDPLATSAWNTLITGKKRWVLFPPHVPKRVAKGRGLIRKNEDDEAIHYFMTILPRIKQQALKVGNHGDYENFACYEFTQNAGETVFIPNGWWHAVLNLTHTVGITQNFCSTRNFDQVWIETRTGRKRMAYKLLCQLEERYPHLAQRARRMNKRDNFVMKYDPVEIRRREKEEERRKEKKREVTERKKERHRSKEREKHSSRSSDEHSYMSHSAPHSTSSTDRSRDSKRSRIERRHVPVSPS
eukprot:scaffold2957_cov55-Attheya_sp.AAC.4